MVTISNSIIITNEQIKPPQTNFHGNAHGGELMKIMDEIAALCSSRVANEQCVTARISTVNFHTPVREGNIVNVKTYVYETGETSLKVFVKVKREKLESNKDSTVATTARFTMVAVDKNGNPKETNDIQIETLEDKKLYNEAKNIMNQ